MLEGSIILIWCLVWLFIGRIIGHQHGDETLGGLLGLFLGPIGVILFVLTHSACVPCAHCGTPLRDGQPFCPSCGRRRGAFGRRSVPSEPSIRLNPFPARREVICPHCGALLRAMCGLKGFKVHCPQCGKRFRPIPRLASKKRPERAPTPAPAKNEPCRG